MIEGNADTTRGDVLRDANLGKDENSDQKKVDKFQVRSNLVARLRSLFRMAKTNKNSYYYENYNAHFVDHKEVNSLDREGYCALYYACSRGCLAVVSYIINKLGGDIN